MADNDWKARLGMVYSTNPDFNYETTETPEAETLPPARQELRVWLDRKQRAGKVVTLVKGFVGRDADLQELARLLNISDNQLSYITNVDSGRGLIKCGSAIVPFVDSFPRHTRLYQMMTTRPSDLIA